MTKYLKNIIAGIGTIVLYAGLAGTSIAQEQPKMTTPEKIEYIMKFQRNYLQSRGINVKKKEELSLMLILNSNDRKDIGRVANEEIQSRAKKKWPLTSDGFAEAVYFYTTREDDGEKINFQVLHRPGEDTGIAFSDNILCDKPNKCSNYGFELYTPHGPDRSLEHAVAFDKLKGISVDRTTMYVTGKGFGKVFSYEDNFAKESLSREITKEDMDLINREYDKILGRMVRVLKQRYGDKYNQP